MKLFRAIRLRLRKFRYLHLVRSSRGVPRLLLPERYERPMRWILRFLTSVGLVLSVIALSPWYFSFAAALGLLLTEQFFERVVFRYTTLVLQPMPEFEYKSEEWCGMGFVMPRGKAQFLNQVVLGFEHEEYAIRFFQLIRWWNYEEEEDSDRNVRLSFLWETEQKYHVLLYPSLERAGVEQDREETEDDLRLEKYGKEHLQLVMQVVFCKAFEDKGSLRQFLADQAVQARPFQLTVGVLSSGGQLTPIGGIQPILMHELLEAHWSDLDTTSFEYQFRSSMGF